MALVLIACLQTASEQLMIYEINRARSNPQAYAAEQGLGALLDGIAPAAPLAVNPNLTASARFHAQEMATFDYFGHQSAVTGDWPNQMALDAGYPLPWPADQNTIESLAAGYADVSAALRGLIEDAGVNPPGHRYHLLATGPGADFWLSHREIGIGFAENGGSTFGRYYAIHTAHRTGAASVFVTGVVYADGNGNGRYDLGEGLAGVTVTDGFAVVTTGAAGGYAIQATDGAALVITCSGGAFSGTSAATVTMAGSNREVDFMSGTAAGEVGFGSQSFEGGSGADEGSGAAAASGGGGGGGSGGCSAGTAGGKSEGSAIAVLCVLCLVSCVALRSSP